MPLIIINFNNCAKNEYKKLAYGKIQVEPSENPGAGKTTVRYQTIEDFHMKIY